LHLYFTAQGKTAMHAITDKGFLRVSQIVGRRATKRNPAIPPIIPVCRSTWLAGVKNGKYPAPVKLSERVTAWRVADVVSLISTFDAK
jgi:prophage regulatory protein